MHRSTRPLIGLTASILIVAGCGGQRQIAVADGVQAAHDEDRVSIVGTDSNGDTVRGSTEALVSNDCILLGDACITPEAAGDFCEGEDGPIDVIVVDGEVVEVVCYPAANEAGDEDTFVVGGNGDIDVPQNANNTTVTFDADTNDEAIEGDLVIDGNNVAVYGNGVDETVLRGNVVLDGNNVRLRGLTIDGDLTLAKNNLAAVFVVVTGNVIIAGNNSVLSGSVVFGDTTINGNNTVFVQNHIGGALTSPGNTEICEDNRAFSDENDDGLIASTELGDGIGCEG